MEGFLLPHPWAPLSLSICLQSLLSSLPALLGILPLTMYPTPDMKCGCSLPLGKLCL